MFIQKLSKTLLLSALLIFVLSSCEESEFYPDGTDYDALSEEIENLTADIYTEDLAELDMRSEDDEMMQRFRGKHKCFSFVFPITIVFPDGSEETVESREEFRELMHTWKGENPDAEDRPIIQMPFDVELKDGTTQTIENEEQLEALKEDCFENRPHFPRFKMCFEPVFPINISIPDGDIVEVEDMEALRTLLKEWKEANPDAEVRPEIVFPIDIITKDGDTITLESMEELRDYLKDCVEKRKKHGKKKKKGNK